MPKYYVNGKTYNIPEEKEKDFLLAYPKAELKSPLKNFQEDTTEGPTEVSDTTGSTSEDTSSDLQDTSDDFTNETLVLSDNKTDVKDEDKEIMVTLTADQKISMKLKGKRTGAVSIGIDELYAQLTGKDIGTDEPKEQKAISIKQSDEKPTKKNPMILLSDLRSMNAISGGDYQQIAHFDNLIKNLMDNMRK